MIVPLLRWAIQTSEGGYFRKWYSLMAFAHGTGRLLQDFRLQGLCRPLTN